MWQGIHFFHAVEVQPIEYFGYQQDNLLLCVTVERMGCVVCCLGDCCYLLINNSLLSPVRNTWILHERKSCIWYSLCNANSNKKSNSVCKHTTFFVTMWSNSIQLNLFSDDAVIKCWVTRVCGHYYRNIKIYCKIDKMGPDFLKHVCTTVLCCDI